MEQYADNRRLLLLSVPSKLLVKEIYFVGVLKIMVLNSHSGK
jgi:hypothetical protein